MDEKGSITEMLNLTVLNWRPRFSPSV